MSGGARPHEVVAALIRELARGRADGPRARGHALGGRGDARRPQAARSQDRCRSGAGRSPATETTSSTARIRCGSCSASWRASEAISRLALEPLSRAAVAELAEPHGVDGEDALPEDGRQSVLRHRGAGGGSRRRPRRRVRDAVLARAGAAVGPRRGGCSRRSRSSRQQAELWLLEALAGDAVDRLEECLARACWSPAGTASPSGTSSRALTIEESLAAESADRVCTSRRSRRSPAPPGGAWISPGSPTTPRRRTTPKPCCGSRRQRPRARPRSARIARPPPSTRARCASPDGLPLDERAELLDRCAARVLPHRRVRRRRSTAPGAGARVPPRARRSPARKETRCARSRASSGS